MEVTFWGTRGSIATPGYTRQKYGGNTTCLEVRCGDTTLILDAGTGIRSLSSRWMSEPELLPGEVHLLMTHLHWDHIQGFPFFAPAYEEGTNIHIYGEEHPEGSILQLMGGQMGGQYFPIPFQAMHAEMHEHRIEPSFHIDEVEVRTMRLPHPGDSLAFRITAGDAVFILATDCELDAEALNSEELQENFYARRRYEPEFLEFFQGAHLLVLDCQFTDEMYRTRTGWGHNAVATVVDFCRQTSPEMLALFHHDPESTDDQVTMMATDCYERVVKMSHEKPLVFGARERMQLDVSPPKRPPRVRA